MSSDVRTADPIELSSRVIDAGEADEPVNRVTNELAEIDDDVALVESFSHMVVFRTDDGLVAVDASGPMSGAAVVESLRSWSTDRIDSLVYTHGHVDHVGGSGAVMADADRRDHAAPTVIGHENVAPRFERYVDTNGYNQIINRRQFGGISPRHGLGLSYDEAPFLPHDTVWPTETYRDSMTRTVGGLDLEIHHDKGETDDHSWAWVPAHRALCVGDLVTWVFPNAGNPQKVQRYPGEWAAALRRMAEYDAELLLPAHGLPIRGTDRIRTVLTSLAEALEFLVERTVAMMNEGASLDEILNTVTLPAEWLTRPWMNPVYDEPEFVVRNVWRLYGGWWDLDPSRLKPSPAAAIAAEHVALAGGLDAYLARARELADAGDLRLACHLVETAVQAEPESIEAHGARAEVYAARRAAESSLMSKGIFAAAARESAAVVSAADEATQDDASR